MPVVHTTPNATPKTIRPLTSSTSDGAACSRHAEHSSTPAARSVAPPGAEPVGDEPGRDRDRERCQSRQREQQRRLGRSQVVDPRQPRQQRHDHRLRDPRHEEQRVKQPEQLAGRQLGDRDGAPGSRGAGAVRARSGVWTASVMNSTIVVATCNLMILMAYDRLC